MLAPWLQSGGKCAVERGCWGATGRSGGLTWSIFVVHCIRKKSESQIALWSGLIGYSWFCAGCVCPQAPPGKSHYRATRGYPHPRRAWDVCNPSKSSWFTINRPREPIPTNLAGLWMTQVHQRGGGTPQWHESRTCLWGVCAHTTCTRPFNCNTSPPN